MDEGASGSAHRERTRNSEGTQPVTRKCPPPNSSSSKKRKQLGACLFLRVWHCRCLPWTRAEGAYVCGEAAPGRLRRCIIRYVKL